MRTQDPEEYAKRIRTNPYLEEVYAHPDWIVVHPTPERFAEAWASRAQGCERIHLEIGCGSGRYLTEWAGRHPQDAFLGLELRYKRLALSARKLQQRQLSNVLLMRERGEYFDEYFGPGSLDVLHVNFPDPWPKKGHAKNRLMSPEFLLRFRPYLRPEGEIRFKTDHPDYFAWVGETLRGLSEYRVLDDTDHLQHSVHAEENILTEFELLFRSKGDPPIGYLRAGVA